MRFLSNGNGQKANFVKELQIKQILPTDCKNNKFRQKDKRNANFDRGFYNKIEFLQNVTEKTQIL